MRRRPFGLEPAGIHGRRKTRSRLNIEALEDRRLLATILVTSTGDSGTGTLRDAINMANTMGGSDEIDFQIPGAGVKTITPATPLPTIAEAVFINGASEAAFIGGPSTTPLIQLDGSGIAGVANNGLTVNITVGTTPATVQGLAIGGFSGAGVALTGVGGNSVLGNLIGTTPAGTAAAANATGILITGSPNNIIGGSVGAARNVISGNTGAGISISGTTSTGNLIQNNLIGIDVNGSLPVPNSNGVVISGAANNTIGGTSAALRNTISDNTGSGISLTAAGTTGNVVAGNYIGLNSSGTAAAGNSIGIQVANTATANTIGGNASGARNVISGNASSNILITGSTSNVIAGNTIGENSSATGALAGTQASVANIELENGASNNTIGGTGYTGTSNNVIGGATGPGIQIRGLTPSTMGAVSAGNVIQGNFIGLTLAGTIGVSNLGGGVVIRDGSVGNTIGAATGGLARNVISGNGAAAVSIVGTTSNSNVLQGNLIGVQVDGVSALSNSGDGVFVDGPTSATIGGSVSAAGNTIANEGGAGVFVSSGTGIAINRNSIFGNAGLGIDLAPRGVNPNAAVNPGVGPNNLQNYPVLTGSNTALGVTTVTGSLQNAPNTAYTIEFFSNTLADKSGNGQGRTFVGSTSVTTDASGRATFSAPTTTPVAANAVVSATATDPGGNTSEFSANVTNTTPSADLALTVTAVPEPVAAGGIITYTLTVKNSGPVTASNVTVTNTLPTGVNFLGATSSTGSITQSGSIVTATVGSLAAGATATMTITVLAPSVGTLTDTATVGLSENDPNTANNTAIARSTVVQGVDLVVSSSSTPSSTTVGSPVTLTFVVTNTSSTNTATNVVLTAPLPAGATPVVAGSSQGTSQAVAGMLAAAIGSLAPGASATVNLVLNPTGTGTLSTTATVSSDQTDVNPLSNTTSVSVSVAAASASPAGSDGPRVIGLDRAGVHAQPSTVVLAFNGPLNVTSAQAISNYRLVYAGRDHKFGTKDDVAIRLASASYDATTNVVRIRTRKPFSLRKPVQITVVGTAPNGVKDASGILLDGLGNGVPGSNFVKTFTGVGPGRISGSGA